MQGKHTKQVVLKMSLKMFHRWIKKKKKRTMVESSVYRTTQKNYLPAHLFPCLPWVLPLARAPASHLGASPSSCEPPYWPSLSLSPCGKSMV